MANNRFDSNSPPDSARTQSVAEANPPSNNAPASLHACLSTVGTANFYQALVELANEGYGCERYLVMRYTRFATPEFLFNSSLRADAVEFYLGGLYRFDPLLRLVETGQTKPVESFRQILLEDEGNQFYDEIFRSGKIYDELAVMIPILGGCVALCLDRDGSEFSRREVSDAMKWQPALAELHNLHVKMCLLTGLTSLFGRGSVGVLGVAAKDNVFYRNEVWSKLADELNEDQLIERAFQFPPQKAAAFGDGIVHWDYLDASREGIKDCRMIFFEAHSADTLNADVRGRLVEFCVEHDLSPREREIVMEMTKGCHNVAISRRLGLTVGTVKNYKRRLYDKLDITNEREILPRIISYLFKDEEQS